MEERIIERVIRLLDERGMSDKELCQASGIKQSTFATWKQNGRSPKITYAAGIANALGVSEKYLLTGEELSVIDEITIEVNKRPELVDLFNVVKKANKEQVEQIIKMIEAFVK
jgi:transcriptional regulator with XRE-family HTH domain